MIFRAKFGRDQGSEMPPLVSAMAPDSKPTRPAR